MRRTGRATAFLRGTMTGSRCCRPRRPVGDSRQRALRRPLVPTYLQQRSSNSNSRPAMTKLIPSGRHSRRSWTGLRQTLPRGNSRRPRSRQLPRSWRRKRPSVQRSKLPRTMPLLPLLLQPLLLHQPRAHPPVLPPAVQEAPLVHRLLPPVLQPLPILRGMTSSMRPSRSKRKWLRPKRRLLHGRLSDWHLKRRSAGARPQPLRSCGSWRNKLQHVRGRSKLQLLLQPLLLRPLKRKPGSSKPHAHSRNRSSGLMSRERSPGRRPYRRSTRPRWFAPRRSRTVALSHQSRLPQRRQLLLLPPPLPRQQQPHAWSAPTSDLSTRHC